MIRVRLTSGRDLLLSPFHVSWAERFPAKAGPFVIARMSTGEIYHCCLDVWERLCGSGGAEMVEVKVAGGDTALINPADVSCVVRRRSTEGCGEVVAITMRTGVTVEAEPVPGLWQRLRGKRDGG